MHSYLPDWHTYWSPSEKQNNHLLYINDQQSYKINKEFWCKLLHNITAFLTFYCFEQVWDCWYWCNTNQTCFKKFWLSCSSYLHRSQITVEAFLHCLRSACVYLIPFQVMEGEGKKSREVWSISDNVQLSHRRTLLNMRSSWQSLLSQQFRHLQQWVQLCEHVAHLSKRSQNDQII